MRLGPVLVSLTHSLATSKVSFAPVRAVAVRLGSCTYAMVSRIESGQLRVAQLDLYTHLSASNSSSSSTFAAAHSYPQEIRSRSLCRLGCETCSVSRWSDVTLLFLSSYLPLFFFLPYSGSHSRVVTPSLSLPWNRIGRVYIASITPERLSVAERSQRLDPWSALARRRPRRLRCSGSVLLRADSSADRAAN